MSDSNHQLMARGAKKLVDVCARTRAGESILIVTDQNVDSRLPEALCVAGLAAGAHPEVLVTAPSAFDSGEPNAVIASKMRSCDVVFTPVSVSLTHTLAVKQACHSGTRIVAMTQWTPEMMMGGGIEADFVAIEPRVLAVSRRFDEGHSVSLETSAGTRLELDIRGRLGTPHAKTGIARKGTFQPVPDIEAPVSPVTAEGRIVCDASIPYLGIGLLDEPVTLEVRDGNVVSIAGGRAASRVEAAWKAINDPTVYNVAELGIGMNPHCRLIGVMLEDEGVASTCHIGVGSSMTLGGTVKAPCHYDFVLQNPTITIDGRLIMDQGTLCL